MTCRVDFQHPNVVLVLRGMPVGSCWSIHDFRAFLGGSKNVSIRVIRFLRDAGCLYIAQWQRVRCGRPLYALGSSLDMVKPTRLPKAATQRAYTKRKTLAKKPMARRYEMGREVGTVPRPKVYRGNCGSTLYRPKGETE